MDAIPEPARRRGVANPRVVDLIRLDEASDEVVLVMLEERAWDSVPEQLRQLEDKFNAYLGYVLDGHLAREYPQYAGRAVRFQLECATPPGEAERRFLTAAGNFAAAEKISFVVAALTADGPPGD